MLAAIVLAGATTACGNPLSPAEETQTAVAGASTPVQRTPPSTQQTLAVATPMILTALPESAGARTDCPQGFATYRDVAGVMSVCSPEWLLVSSDVNNDGAPGISVSTPDDAPAALPRVTLASRVTPRPKFSASSTPSTLCDYDAVASQVSIELVHLNVAGLDGFGCHAIGETQSPSGPLEVIDFSSALPSPVVDEQRYLSFTLTWRKQSAGAQELAYQIMSSIALR
jgi:hypothetical protein